MDHMNDSWLWYQGSKCYEQLRVVDDMNYSGLWAQGSRCYEKLKGCGWHERL